MSAHKRVAIVQSNYIPWKGYFDLIRRVDEFVLLDDVQFTRRDWRNRNRIKTEKGVQWLTIPVEVKGKYRQAIKDTRISDPQWGEKHWARLRHAYSRAPEFSRFAPRLEALYQTAADAFLSQVNFRFLTEICDILGIDTQLSWSMDYEATDQKTERLLDICLKAGATEYLSGPAARAYLDQALFDKAGIKVLWMDYEDYPEYPQIHPPFDPHVTVLDLLFHTGADALRYMLAPSAP